jgi:hypothetical protein
MIKISALNEELSEESEEEDVPTITKEAQVTIKTIKAIKTYFACLYSL